MKKKIIKLKDLVKIIGKRPRKKKVILCHGNFDVVHPGHIRHLAYAKSQADVLIVSITADLFIEKGTNKPFVPENIRAESLASFENVDYVFIDNNSKPLQSISKLKPDFFAKGFEYTSKGLNPATREELKELEKYGGKIMFTPGDVIYSSTKLINLSRPQIEAYKLEDLIKKENINLNELSSIIKKFKKLKVHVIGDTIVDTYTNSILIGGYLKTPTPSVLYQGKKDFVGGAGIVAKHLKKAGADVTFTSVLGNDKLKDYVIKDLKKAKIHLNCIVDETRPTTNKNVVIANDYKLLKIDKLDNQPISQSILNKIKTACKKKSFDAVIFCDFRHGIFNKQSISELIESIKSKTLKVADSQVATRWGNITDFKDFDLITPNEKEARFSIGDQDSNVSQIIRNLSKISRAKNIILKLGDKGAIAVKNKNLKNINSYAIPPFSNTVIDAVGAGDGLLAYSTLSYLITKSISISCIMGSIAAACVCETQGNEAVDPSKIENKLKEIKRSLKYKTS